MASKQSKNLKSLLNLIRERNEEQDLFPPTIDIDPRSITLNPKKHTKEQLEEHYLLCKDIDLLAKTLGPDEWDDDL